VLENLGKYSETRLAEFSRQYHSDESLSIQQFKNMHQTYVLSVPWVLEKLVDRIDVNTTKDADRMFNFIKQLFQDYLPNTCPALNALIVKINKAGFKTTAVCEQIALAKSPIHLSSRQLLLHERLIRYCNAADNIICIKTG